MRPVKLTMGLIIVVAAFNLFPGLASAQDQEAEKAVRTVALDYIEGWYSADTVRMARALSPELKKIGFLVSPKTGEVVRTEATYAQMLKWTGQKPNEMGKDPSISIKVEVIEVGQNIAMVKTTSPQFVDYIELGRSKGLWKIYNVVWEPNTAGSK